MKTKKMRRNLKFLLIAFIVSIPFWWGVDLLSNSITKILLEWELKTNPEILEAYAAQQILGKKLEEAVLWSEALEEHYACEKNQYNSLWKIQERLHVLREQRLRS